MGLLRPLLRLVKARRFTFSVITSRGYKSRWSPLHTTTSSCTIRHFLLTSFPTSKKKEREKTGKKKRKKGGLPGFQGVLPLLPSQSMAEQDWTPSKVTQDHLEGQADQGFMTAMELAACHVPEDPVFPAPAKEYVVTFVAFYERGFGVPLHWFLCSLLQQYSLELHNLTPSGVLHIMAFMTLCDAYMGIDPQVDLWNYFFRVRRLQDLDAELTI
jgi:hypothetical protein